MAYYHLGSLTASALSPSTCLSPCAATAATTEVAFASRVLASADSQGARTLLQSPSVEATPWDMALISIIGMADNLSSAAEDFVDLQVDVQATSPYGLAVGDVALHMSQQVRRTACASCACTPAC